MKNAKIMLTAIVVLAVVGAALAFKAKSFQNPEVYCDDGGETCPAVDYVTQDAGNGSTDEPCGAGITTWYTTTDCGPEQNGTVYTKDLL